MPNLLLRWEIIAPVNCGPLSEMITRGTPCRHISADHRASAIVEALELGSGIASGHVVLWHMIVRMHVFPAAVCL